MNPGGPRISRCQRLELVELPETKAEPPHRRVATARINGGLGIRLRYPTYREGLAAILAEEAAAG